MRLDYNEPQKGKEAVVARNALQSYVDQGNNIQSAHIFIALTSTKLQSTKVSFIEFDKTIMLLKGKKMAGIDKYHSYQLTQQVMKVWQYYQIEAGLMIPFDPDLSNQSSSYSVLCSMQRQFYIQHKKWKKKRLTDKKFIFFTVIEELEELEDHMMKGIHEIPAVKFLLLINL